MDPSTWRYAGQHGATTVIWYVASGSSVQPAANTVKLGRDRPAEAANPQGPGPALAVSGLSP